MKKIPLLLSLITFTVITASIAAERVTVWGTPSEIKSLKNFSIQDTSAATKPLISSYLSQSVSVNTLKIDNTVQDSSGASHEQYNQYFAGILVWPNHIVFHKNGNKTLVTGSVINGLASDAISTAPTLSPEQAKEIAVNNAKQQGMQALSLNLSRLIIYAPTASAATKQVSPHLAYLITLKGKDKQAHPSLPHYIIDAHSGAILNYYQGLETNDLVINRGAGPGGNNVITSYRRNNRYNFGSGGSPLLGGLRLTQNGTKCAMKNEYVELRSWENKPVNEADFPVMKFQESLHPIFEFSCYNNMNDSGKAPINQGIAPNNDALYFATETFTMLDTFKIVTNVKQLFGMSSQNDKLVVITHVGDFDNAFAVPARQDDGSVNSNFHSQFIIGNGEYFFTPLTDAMIVAHELGHIVTASGSNLVYWGQAGGLNEAYSDIQGIALAAYLHQRYSWYTYDWTLGASVYKLQPVVPLRYFYKPSLDGASSFGDASIDDANDFTEFMDPHHSSGVINRAFYIFANLLAGHKVPGINDAPLAPNDTAILRAARYFAVANHNLYWSQDATFAEAACGVIQAALDGKDTAAADKAAQAFAAVHASCPSAKTLKTIM